MEEHDVLVAGGGAAGLSAALVLLRARRTVVVVDAGAPRNGPAAHMHGWRPPGRRHRAAGQGSAAAIALNAELVDEDVVRALADHRWPAAPGAGSGSFR